MIKMFCDGCGIEIHRNYASERLVKTKVLNDSKFRAEIIIEKDGSSNSGHLCVACVYRIVN